MADNMSSYQAEMLLAQQEALLMTSIDQLQHRAPGAAHGVLDPTIVSKKRKGRAAVGGRAKSSTEKAGTKSKAARGQA
jgi:hypothetical protein